jgi:hypothetical protein
MLSITVAAPSFAHIASDNKPVMTLLSTRVMLTTAAVIEGVGKIERRTINESDLESYPIRFGKTNSPIRRLCAHLL